VQKCPLCGKGCPEGHFHAVDAPADLHLCGEEHACGERKAGKWEAHHCEHKGACAIEGNIETVKKQFHGKRGQFEYDHVTKQDMKRQVCTVKIPPGCLTHEGPHSCGRKAGNHFCGEPCPQCGYRCASLCGRRASAQLCPQPHLVLLQDVAQLCTMQVQEACGARRLPQGSPRQPRQ
jgi:hypothetical protein